MASSKRLLFLLGLLIGYVLLISSKVAATHDQPRRVSQEMDKKRGSDRRYGYYRGFDKGVGVSFQRVRPDATCSTWSRSSGCG
ncbi:hypothetical protein ACS0TY_017369 [Phlomoides rotata]